jgi:hypothetical protein
MNEIRNLTQLPSNNSFEDTCLLDPWKDQQSVFIQKVFRGFLNRKSFLPQSLYSKYAFECENVNHFTPQAEGGKIAVYLPKDLPTVVLKEIGRDNAVKRFCKIETIRKGIREKGLTQLIVPKVRLYKEFLVEERLPVRIDPAYNAGLYLRNKELFNEPVLQMTRLFAKFYIGRLVNLDVTGSIVECIRYDNIPFLLREKEGKQSIEIGLIDLEHAEEQREVESAINKLYLLTLLFPFHKEIIQEEFGKSFPILKKHRYGMSVCANISKKYLEIESRGFAGIEINRVNVKNRS